MGTIFGWELGEVSDVVGLVLDGMRFDFCLNEQTRGTPPHPRNPVRWRHLR